jgi:hypothetical protein
MKKTLFTILFVALAAVSASAQSAVGSVYVKPMAGGVLTTLTGNDIDNTKMKIGLVGGAEVGYQLSDQFALTGGLLYTMQGCAFDLEGDPKFNLDYLNVPLLANYYVAPGFAIKAGVQLGIMTRAKSTASANGVSADVDIKDVFNTIDFAVPVGISYEFSDFVIDARYNFGLTKIAKKDGNFQGYSFHDDHNDVKNSVIMLTVGYKIPL